CSEPRPAGRSSRSTVAGTTPRSRAALSRNDATSRRARLAGGKSCSGRSPTMGLYTALSARPACSSTSSRVSLLARGIVPISVQYTEVSGSRSWLGSIGAGAARAVGAETRAAVGLEREGAARAVAAPGADDLFGATGGRPGTGGIEDDAQDFACALVVI